jgi:hypothetical protein
MARTNSVSSLDKHSHSEKDSSVAVQQLTSGEVEALKVSDSRLLRKLDWNLLPLVSILHLLSFL